MTWCIHLVQADKTQIKPESGGAVSTDKTLNVYAVKVVVVEGNEKVRTHELP